MTTPRRSWNPALFLALLIASGAAIASCDGCSSTPIPGEPCPTACAEGTYCCHQSKTCETEQPSCTNLQSCPAGFTLTYPARPFMDGKTCTSLPLECSCTEGQGVRPGIHGRHAALTAVGDRLLASAYENSYGDLLLISAPLADLASPTLEILDGVPGGSPTGTSGYRGGIDVPGDDVGLDTDILTAPSGALLISYHDASNRTLKLAARPGDAWASHVVDSPRGEKEIVGRTTSLVLDEGKPAIAYLVLNIAGAEGTFTSELRWAAAATEVPAAASDWTITVVESRPMPCQNLCADNEVCQVLGKSSSACRKKGSGCAACPSGEECVDGTCQPVLPRVTYSDVPRASGLWPVALSTEAGPLAIFADRLAGQLKGAIREGEGWRVATLKENAAEQLGAFPAAVVDGPNLIHVVYQNASRLTLHYLQVSPSLATAASEVIDDGLRPDGLHPVGADSALLLDASGGLRVIYQDQLTADLLVARREGPARWTPDTPTDAARGRQLKGGPPGFGFYNDLVLHEGKVYGCTFTLDPQGTPNGALTFFEVP